MTACFVTGLGMTIAGCSTGTTVRFADRMVTAEMVHETVGNNALRLSTMVGNGRITVETPEISQSGSFELTLRRPDSVLVKLGGPFGIEVGSALLTRYDFLFYNSFQNQVISGTTNPANLSRILRVALSFDDVLNLFTGGTFLTADRSSPDEFLEEDDSFVLVYRDGSGSRRYRVDPSSLLIQRIQLVDRSGRLVAEQTFTRHRSVNGTMVPYHIRMTLPRERRSVSVSYSDVLLNEGNVRFSLTIPDNAERVQLQ
ncbi:MAG: DUF4292 domain-containing protein [Bacteroidota bacterium]